MRRFNRFGKVMSAAMMLTAGGVLAAGALLAHSGTATARAPQAAALAAATAATMSQIAASGECIFGVSKDSCVSEFSGGQGNAFFCPSSNCQTLTVRDATFKAEFVSSNLRCTDNPVGPAGICDEVGPEKDGTLKVAVSFDLRLQRPCRFRGWLNGRGFYYARDGSVFEGEIRGAIGVGADRKPRCISTGPIASSPCESCLDVDLDTSQNPNIWRVGIEWIFEGKRTDIPTGETIRLNLSGDLRAPGDINGPFDPNAFRYTGTGDGIYTKPCF